MKDKLEAWTVETVDLTAKVASAIGASPENRELVEELRALRREINELRVATTRLQDEVSRLRVASPVRRITPFGSLEGLARLS